MRTEWTEGASHLARNGRLDATRTHRGGAACPTDQPPGTVWHDLRLTTPIPVRFPSELLDETRKRAEADDRPDSAWIRRAVEHEFAPLS